MRSFAHKMIHFVPTKRLDFLVEYKQKKAQGGNTVDYGKNLARLRINANMSQEELASHLFVSRDLVSKWENNKRRPGYDALQKMASLFSVEPESIIPVEKKLADELSLCIPENCEIAPEQLPEILNGFLKTLSERDSAIFMQRYYFMNSFDCIAGMYALNEVYTRVVLSRTRKKLKKYLESGGLS